MNIGIRASSILALALTGCGGAIAGEVCGTGAHDEMGQCLTDLPDASQWLPPEMVDGGPDATRDSGAGPPESDAGTDAAVRLDADAADTANSFDAGDLVQHCLLNENVMYLNGEPTDYIHPGPLLIVGGGPWVLRLDYLPNGQPDAVVIDIGISWSAMFTTRGLGQPIVPGSYENAQRYAFAEPGHPGLDVSGESRACSSIAGRFQVLRADVGPSPDGGHPVMRAFTAVFEQHCEGFGAPLRGCIHFQQ